MPNDDIFYVWLENNVVESFVRKDEKNSLTDFGLRIILSTNSTDDLDFECPKLWGE